jgi:putative flippase GtrA
LVASPTVVTREATRAPRAAVAVLRVPNPRRVNKSAWTQLLRFCTVGACGYVVNLAVYSALVKGAGVHYIPAAVVAFCIAWSCNFACNKWWTFRRHGLSALEQGARYLLVSVVALGLGLLVLHLLVSAGADRVLAQALAIVAVTPVSFLLNRRWSFR